MPNRSSFIDARRSPRFCTHNASSAQPQVPTTRRSLRFLQKNDISAPEVPEHRRSRSADRQVHHSDARLVSLQHDSLETPESVHKNISKISSKQDVSSRNEDLNSGSKKSPTLGNEFEGIRILRRSSRLSFVRKTDNELEDCNAEGSKNSGASEGRSRNLKNLSPGVRRSPRLNNWFGGYQTVGNTQDLREKYALVKCRPNQKKSSNSDDKLNSLHVQIADTSVRLRGKTLEKRERRTGNSSKPEAVTAKDGKAHAVVDVRKEKFVAKRKRKRDDDEIGIKLGWTKEQETALQRAYYAAKPTPQFWKKVSRLVPGKSAQDCFDKIHSDHSTPPQRGPRSRKQAMKSSPIELLSLSEGKLLNLNDANIQKPSRSRKKSYMAQKTVRHLLQKNYQGAKNHEADLFSLLEPNINLSYQSPKPSRVISTSPSDLQGKQALLHTCHERSLSNHKRPLSRFSSSIVSPPVLKQVKNRALHEKYIDQLHCREAKRKAASRNSKNCISEKEVPKDVRAARNALISDTRDAINQLQHLHTDTMTNSLDFDSDDGYDNLENENEEET